MERDFSKQFSGEFNEPNFENPCFSWEFNFANCKINEIFPLQKFLLLLSSPYSLLKSSHWEVIWKSSDLKPVTGDLEIRRKRIQIYPSEFKHFPSTFFTEFQTHLKIRGKTFGQLRKTDHIFSKKYSPLLLNILKWIIWNLVQPQTNYLAF